jgi:hypothetical protein
VRAFFALLQAAVHVLKDVLADLTDPNTVVRTNRNAD